MEIPQSRGFNGKNNDKIDGYTYLYISIDMKIYKMDMYKYINLYKYIVMYGERERYIYIYIYTIYIYIITYGKRLFSDRPNWIRHVGTKKYYHVIAQFMFIQ